MRLERTGFIQPFAISPDGRSVAAAVTDNASDNIVAVPLDSGPPRAITANRLGNFFPSWSPNGRSVAYLSWREGVSHLAIVSSTGGRERTTLTGVGPPLWVSDSSVVTFHQDTMLIVDTLDRTLSHWQAPATMSFRSIPVLSPARDRMAAWSLNASAVVISDLKTKSFKIFRSSAFTLTPEAWGTDGSVYALTESQRADGLAQREPRLVRIPPDGGTPVMVFDLPAGAVSIAVDTDARHAVVLVQKSHPDLWVGEVR